MPLLEALSPGQEAELLGFLRDQLRPPPQISVADWGAQNVIIPPGAETHSGSLNWDRAPYAREPLQCFADRSIRELVLPWATQCLKTTVIRCGAMYRIANDPLPLMWVLPNEQKVAAPFSKNRWQPLLLACGATSALVPRTAAGKVDRIQFGMLEQTFTNGMPLAFVGSNSPANLSSRPVGLLLMDEIDKFGLETEFEPGALDNAEERAKNSSFPLIVKASSPTIATNGIWRAFLGTDQRYFYIPCPRCERLIIFKFWEESSEHGVCGLRWYDEDPREVQYADGNWDLRAVVQAAHYRCQGCGGKVYEGERAAMVRAEIAKWVAHQADAPANARGYHLNSFYSLISPECTLPKIAEAWCKSKGDIGRRHRIINSTLAEPWNVGKGFDETAVAKEDAGQWVIPADGLLRVMTVDYQFIRKEFWVVVRFWAQPTEEKPEGESWLQLANRFETEEELVEAQEQFQVPSDCCFMDIAGRPNEAGRIILRHGWRGLMGSDKLAFPHRMSNGLRIERIYSEVMARDAHAGTRAQDRVVPFQYVKWAKDPVRDLVTALRHKTPTIWHVHSTPHPDYQRHLNAHVKLVRVNPRTGAQEGYWHEKHNDDHLWDGECMQAAVAVRRGFAMLDGGVEAKQGDLFKG